jgi:hypothetical protein
LIIPKRDFAKSRFHDAFDCAVSCRVPACICTIIIALLLLLLQQLLLLLPLNQQAASPSIWLLCMEIAVAWSAAASTANWRSADTPGS